ncbi:XrtA/PEP-CTERM system-associated ATPase [Sphingomonas prati]|uniref:Putative secretion ATPase (PEP-CTERM system associated) n=1 Tax=Sphingomonas prati TaxID=1843237 RepID=A0A7W9BR47_9SPHN|nr:XrtA/PEP-CTERM system-associated ATPase [Sphingomonas prati]MBB5728602.1 putative secretion ATPase (PEP-CTERM system associated) [Sphingomonas prati]GGE72506.1 ATPase [Sphingomonas prati]
MYQDHYGLTDRPFQLTPDPRFWFESATHRKAMAYLGYGLAQGEGFIVITGDIGAGKTTLVAHLMETVDPQRLTAVRLVSTQADADQLVALVAQAFGVGGGAHDKAALIDRIERHLVNEARSGRRTLLIVDEAQTLSLGALEELRMLSNFQTGNQPLLQIFLLGQPEFRELLQQSDRLEQLRQRVIATHHLDPMTANEVEPYMLHRLARVGWAGNPDFEPAAYDAFFSHSGGVPRKLNQIAGRVLLAAAVEDRTVIDAALVDSVASEMDGDANRPRAAAENEPRLRSASVTPLRAEPAYDARLNAIEARQDELESSLRRVLGLLIDWVESDAPLRSDRSRHNAA